LEFVRFIFSPFGFEIGYAETPTEYEISLVAEEVVWHSSWLARGNRVSVISGKHTKRKAFDFKETHLCFDAFCIPNPFCSLSMFAVLTWILGILREYLLWLKFFLRFSPLFAVFKSRSISEPWATDCGEISTSISTQGDLGLSLKFVLHLDDSNLLFS
jgi:hypothetical protein